MSVKFLERLEAIVVPEEFKELLDTAKLFMSSDEDLNDSYEIDGKVISFTKIGESATMQVHGLYDEESEFPLLVAGF